MNRISVALFKTHADADPVQQRLVKQGIKAEIKDHIWWETVWFVTKSTGCAHLDVLADQLDAALKILGDMANEGALNGAIHCPDCGSTRVDYPQFTRKSLLTNFFMGLGAELRLVERDFYCEDCHFTWPKEGMHPSRLRPNMAPYYFIEGVPQNVRPPAAGAKSVRT